MAHMSNPGLTLFCFPCAGASASVYLSWRRTAPPWLRIEPVELPGRGPRIAEPLICDFEPLVAQLTDELAPRLPPAYALFGHSFGGLIAYGCSHKLAARKYRSPRALLIACCAAPTARDAERLSRLKDDDAIVEKMHKLGGTPAGVFNHPELLRIAIDILRADFAACASFQRMDRSPLGSTIHVFGGRDDDITKSALAAWKLESDMPTTLELFDGGHFFLRDHEGRFLPQIFDKLTKLVRSH